MDPLAMVTPDASQPALPSVPLVWEHVDSDNCLQQLVSIDSVLQVLSMSKKSLTACLGEFDDHGQQSLAVLDSLIGRFEDFQTTARQHLSLRARSLRKNGLRIQDLSPELLRIIFDNLRGNLEERNFWPDIKYKADTVNIQNVRLTCREFRDASSHLLFRYLEVSPSRLSLERLERVMRYSENFRGDRMLRIDMRYYSANIAQNFQLFSVMCREQLRTKIVSIERMLEEEDVGSDDDASEDVDDTASEDFVPGLAFQIPELKVYLEDLIVQHVTKARRILSAWAGLVSDPTDESAHLDEAVVALQRGHEHYRALFQEQDEILRGGHFARAVAAAAARAHSGGRPSVWLYMSDDRGPPEYYLNRTAVREAEGMDIFEDPYRLIESLLIVRSPWWHARDAGEEEPPQSLLYELPLALRAEGVALAGFKTQINTPFTFNLHMSQDQLSGLRETAETLNVFEFHLNEENVKGPDHEDNPEKLAGFYAYLSAAMGRRNVPELSLSIDPHESFFSLGPLLTSPSWQRLRSAQLSHMNMDINALRRFVGMLEPGVCLRLDRMCLTSGTWVTALDLLRSKAGRGSYVIDPRGAECDRMYEEDRNDIFGDCGSPFDPYNKVSLYIASVEGAEHPLRGRRLAPAL